MVTKMLISKSFIFYFSVLTAITLLISQSQCGIEYQQVKNAANVTQFTVIKNKWIYFSNVHRKVSSPELKLSLTGVEISQISRKYSNRWTLHLNDNSTLDISVVTGWRNSTETHFMWKGDKAKEVCFNYGHENNDSYWYSTYESADQKWPMDTSKRIPKSNFNHFSENSGEFYNVLEHLFLNSDGFAIMLDPENARSWFIRRDHSQQGEPILCFSTNTNSYPYSNQIESNEIDFYIFTSSNIRSVAELVYDSDYYIRKPKRIPDESNFIYPTVLVKSTKDEEFLNFSKSLIQNGFTNMDYFLGEWEQNRGDLALRSNISDSTISKLTQQGFRIRLEISNLLNNGHKSTHKYMLKDQTGKLTNLVDFTQPEACEWYESVLKKLYFEEEINHFHLHFESFANMSIHNSNNQNPNMYFTNWLECVTKVDNITSNIGYKTQKFPYFVLAIPHEVINHFQVLQMIIPNALSISTAGYSFFCPYLIGHNIPEQNQEEIYIRWVQAVSLMPCMMFAYMPLDYSKITIELTKKFINLHKEHSAVIIELAKKRVRPGSPIIRPMWYAEPNEPKTFSIDDQFMLGEDIVVAPVVKVGQRERSVYLPTGNWIDIHGKAYKGPGTFVVNAPLEDLPYFKRNIL